MKIKCAKCGGVLYTNPFGMNNTLDCPNCKTRLYKLLDDKHYVRNYFIAEIILVVIMGFVSWYFFNMKILAGLFALNVLIDYLFEVPQRQLMRTGHLRYGYFIFKEDNHTDELSGFR